MQSTDAVVHSLVLAIGSVMFAVMLSIDEATACGLSLAAATGTLEVASTTCLGGSPGQPA